MGRAPFTIAATASGMSKLQSINDPIPPRWCKTTCFSLARSNRRRGNQHPTDEYQAELKNKFNLRIHVLEKLGCVKPWTILSNNLNIALHLCMHNVNGLWTRHARCTDNVCARWMTCCQSLRSQLLALHALLRVVVFMSGAHCVGWRLPNCIEVVAPLISFIYVLGFSPRGNEAHILYSEHVWLIPSNGCPFNMHMHCVHTRRVIHIKLVVCLASMCTSLIKSWLTIGIVWCEVASMYVSGIPWVMWWSTGGRWHELCEG